MTDLRKLKPPERPMTYPVRFSRAEYLALSKMAEDNELTMADLIRFGVSKIPGWKSYLQDAEAIVDASS